MFVQSCHHSATLLPHSIYLPLSLWPEPLTSSPRQQLPYLHFQSIESRGRGFLCQYSRLHSHPSDPLPRPTNPGWQSGVNAPSTPIVSESMKCGLSVPSHPMTTRQMTNGNVFAGCRHTPGCKVTRILGCTFDVHAGINLDLGSTQEEVFLQ